MRLNHTTGARTITNSFQKLACQMLRNANLRLPVVFIGNWIEIGGSPIMSIQGMHDFVSSRIFVRCGCCDSYHQINWYGDCRDDNKCFSADELDEKFGHYGWSEV